VNRPPFFLTHHLVDHRAGSPLSQTFADVTGLVLRYLGCQTWIERKGFRYV
jgi:hypothetical protein